MNKCKGIYKEIYFSIPCQDEMDEVIYETNNYVIKWTNINIPKALPRTRLRPVKNACFRRKWWFEKGPDNK